MKKLIVKDIAIEKIIEYIKNHKDDINEHLALLLTAANVKSENDTHKLPIMYTVDKVLGRKNEPKSTQLKVAVDRALNEIFGPGVMSQVSLTQKLKLRKLYLYILFYLFQKVVSKMDKFERTIV